MVIHFTFTRCRNAIVGGYFLRGVSGGEKKRTCIACKILVDPSFLLLDEPTSGLDSSTSLKLLHVLNNIAKIP
jgi:ABC-type multidrug transport system ATPase subunit